MTQVRQCGGEEYISIALHHDHPLAPSRESAHLLEHVGGHVRERDRLVDVSNVCVARRGVS